MFRRDRRSLSLQVTILVYGMFGLSRLLAMGFDGMPSAGIVGSTVVELVLALGGFMVLIRERRPRVMEPTSNLSPAPCTS